MHDVFRGVTSGPEELPLDNCNTELAYEPSVGRWGCEWPSWLEKINSWAPDGSLIGGTESGSSGCYSNQDVNDVIHNYDLSNNKLDELLDCTQIEGIWPYGHPLPLPTWALASKNAYKVSTTWIYEELATTIELHVHKLLEEHNYNTVGNFLALYEGFQESGCSRLDEFFQR